jgi:hypothetical protein
LLTDGKVNIMTFWVKIISNKGTLLHKAYSQLREYADKGCHYGNLNWAFYVNCWMLNMWNEHDSMLPSIHYIKQRIVDIHIQEWIAAVNASVKLCSYAMFKQLLV